LHLLSFKEAYYLITDMLYIPADFADDNIHAGLLSYFMSNCIFAKMAVQIHVCEVCGVLNKWIHDVSPLDM
jgi:hypothetical protein